MRLQALIALALLTPPGAAEADALRLLAELRERHLPHGMVLDPVFQSPEGDEIAGYSRCGDSAVWTGHLLAAEAYRYAVTRSGDALAGVRGALNGLGVLLDVTGTDLLARCAFPADSPFAAGLVGEERRHGVYGGTLDGAYWQWIGNTSRDQYAGLFFGLTAAWNLVPDPQVQTSVRALATRALGFLQERHWFVVMPGGEISTTFLGRADQQLSLLKLGRRANPGRFETSYKALSLLAAPETIAPVALEVRDPHEAYFKFNLDSITFYGLLTSGDNWWLRLNYKKAYDILRNTTDDHGNAFFNMIDRAINGPNARRDAETRRLLDAWLRRPRRDSWVDLRVVYPSCRQEDRACQPIPVEQRVRTDFLWQRSPFLLYGGGAGTIEGAGLDYILPYWMARYYGVSQE
ncbi:MAG: hypothetical protein HYR60_26655 [Acidobacteria bacterium]|nr:hypothetical protein [Acidobacteriota bacterium]